MRVCVLGAGGREHALAHVLARTAEVVVTPGNPGTALPGRIASTPAPPEEIEADLFVIGPEAPLVAGMADRLRADGRLVLGPGADGARLEGSKAWMKQILGEAGVPTAGYETFTDLDAALRHLAATAPPYVIKTDGLAAGKGVLVTDSLAEAAADVEAKLSGRAFGAAGHRIVIEEGLTGHELSLLVLCDGQRVLPLAPAQDFKRVGDGDLGPNTGGMGAYSPVPMAGPEIVDAVVEQAVEPLVAALRRRGIDYRGVLYAGLMLTPMGPKVVEYNVRFGDPEAQVVLPRLDGDVAGLLADAAAGRLRGDASFTDDACVTVVLAAAGYPSAPRRGDVITGLDDASAVDGVMLFHAGTATDEKGQLMTAGGRVLDVTAMGSTLAVARQRAYEAAGRVHWSGVHYRHDVAELASAGAVPEAR
jgi:phosphoribosylamine--glycine ligase